MLSLLKRRALSWAWFLGQLPSFARAVSTLPWQGRHCPGSINSRWLCPFCCDCTPVFAELHTNSGASFPCSRTEKPTTRVTAQRNRSYKYSRPVSVTPQMRYMSRNRAPAAHRIFPKIATNPDLTDWVNRFCQNIDRQHQTRQLSDALSHALSHGSLP